MLKSLFEDISGSFYSQRAYWNAAHVWKMKTALFVFAMQTIAITILVALTCIPYNFFYDIAKQFPAITVSNHVLSIDEPQPYIIKLPRQSGEQGNLSNEKLIVFDNTGQYTPESPQNSLILITDRTTYLFHSNKTEIYDHSEYEDGSWDTDYYVYLIDWVKLWLWPVFFVVSLLLLAVYALLLSVAGLCVPERALRFAQLYKVAILAITPLVLIDIVASLVGVRVSYWVDWLVIIIFFVFGYKSATRALKDTSLIE